MAKSAVCAYFNKKSGELEQLILSDCNGKYADTIARENVNRVGTNNRTILMEFVEARRVQSPSATLHRC